MSTHQASSSTRSPIGRGHGLCPPGAGSSTSSCSLCDWSLTTAADAAVIVAAFAGDPRHAAARPVVDALTAQAQEHAAQLERVPAAARAGAQIVALAGVLRQWRTRPETAAGVRQAWPTFGAALDTLERVQ